eukprot:8938108-Pyramimonas_sp.AAC.1
MRDTANDNVGQIGHWTFIKFTRVKSFCSRYIFRKPCARSRTSRAAQTSAVPRATTTAACAKATGHLRAS